MSCLSGHQSHRCKTTEWLTPPGILNMMGQFDLDPCAPVVRPWSTAKHHFTINHDGLTRPWFGSVWMNPPFGRDASKWLSKLAWFNNGVALIPARTETRMFFDSVWGYATGILFLRSRPHFHYPDGTRAKFNSGAPICLISYGDNLWRLSQASSFGHVLPLEKTKLAFGAGDVHKQITTMLSNSALA